MYEPWPKRSYPPRWRLALAFLIAPGCAGLLLAIVMPLYAGLPEVGQRIWKTAYVYVLFGAFPLAFVFGLPAYFMLRQHVTPTVINCALTGAAVAGLPWAIVVLLPSAASEASVAGRATVVDGVSTWWGWWLGIEFAGQIAIFGAIAGLIFWVVAVAGHQSDQPN